MEICRPIANFCKFLRNFPAIVESEKMFYCSIHHFICLLTLPSLPASNKQPSVHIEGPLRNRFQQASDGPGVNVRGTVVVGFILSPT